MNDPDEAGWSHIHHCALRGYTKSLERFVDNDPDCLKLETQDDFQSTPFLLAITSGLQDSVQCLVNLGAKVDVVSSQNHGAVEICAIKSQVSLLEYLLSLRLPQLPVWRRLLAMLGSDMDEEVFSAATCLKALTEPSRDGLNPRWEDFYNNGGVPVVVKVAKSSVADDSKVPALQLLLNVLPRPVVSEQLMGGGGGPAIIRLLKSHDPFLLHLAAMTLNFLSHHHQAHHRHLLQRCRRDPYLMHVLKHYGKRYKMAAPLTEGWKHYQKVGLPPISKGRPSLIRKLRSGDELGPITLLSVDTSPQGSGQWRGSEGRLPTIDTTGSGLSRASHHTTQSLVNNGHVSITRHPTDAMILPEIVMVDEV
ncbi:hypothetical protein ACOMHN_017949 [Nucella lapillus]